MHFEWLIFLFPVVSVDEKFLQQSGVWSINQGKKKNSVEWKEFNPKRIQFKSVLTSECLNEFSEKQWESRNCQVTITTEIYFQLKTVSIKGKTKDLFDKIG